MTVTNPPSRQTSPAKPPVELVNCTIDGIAVSVPKGTLIIRAAEHIGIEIPRFCDHPLLSPVAACRACLIEIEGQPKPQPGCAVAVGEGMVVKTQLTSEVADLAQRGVMEFLLINHPLDCPVCDKGGECPLQNQSMTHGNGESRYTGVKRTFPKPIPVSTQILLDRERCVSCARCTRFADEIAGDPFIELFERGAKQQINIAEDQPFDSYFSGNTVQICPVGALTSSDYRFRARPFDLISTPTACEHCASGCAMRTDSRRNTVMRRLAWDDPEVNEEWNCDKGRFAFGYLDHDRLTNPMIRENGELRVASWPEAIDLVARKLAESYGNAAVIPGGRMTLEDAYAYGKFARVALATDDIDFRSRPSSEEERELIASLVAGSGLGVTYSDLETAPVVLLVGLEPEEESPGIFLRLRKAHLAGSTSVAAISSWSGPGLAKLGALTLAAAPGGEGQVLNALRDGSASLSEAGKKVSELLHEPGAIVLVGERLATSIGAISAAVQLAGESGAALAWVPRRAGERGAADAGALAGLLPGGRPIADEAARVEVAAAWEIETDELPTEVGLSLEGIIDHLVHTEEVFAVDVEGSAQAEGTEVVTDDGEIEVAAPFALVIGGVEVGDVARPADFREALANADFVLSLETRLSDVSLLADVVLPVAVDTEKIGSYVDWEGRVREFPKTMRDATQLSDSRVLAMIAAEMDRSIGYGDTGSIRREIAALGNTEGNRTEVPTYTPRVASPPSGTSALLATWRYLLDLGVLQKHEKNLAGTRRPSVARLSAATASSIGAVEGDLVSVSAGAGAITLPLAVTDMPDGVVWVPTNSPGSVVGETLGVTAGATVSISRGASDA